MHEGSFVLRYNFLGHRSEIIPPPLFHFFYDYVWLFRLHRNPLRLFLLFFSMYWQVCLYQRITRFPRNFFHKYGHHGIVYF